jgi:glycosyltransferase involved in cell wall biosynthesis
MDWPVDKKILLFVSEEIENPRKGFDLLLEAMQTTVIPDLLTCVIGISGRSSTTYPGIEFLGKITEERLMAVAYSAADALIIPSREDNLPNTMLESQACGTPVIHLKQGGYRKLLFPDLTGFCQKISRPRTWEKAFPFFQKSRLVYNQ